MTISNVSSISLSSVRPQQAMDWGQRLTDAQKSQLEEIISKYDPENITDAEMKSMLDEIREAGISPGEELKTALEEAGFEVKPPNGGPPPPPQDGSVGGAAEPPEYVKEFIDKVMSGEVTEDDVTAFIASVNSQNQYSTGVMVDEKY